MVYTTRYRLQYVEERDAIRVVSEETPPCPLCGGTLSGYDTRPRSAINGAGDAQRYLLRRLRCRTCHAFHLELPAGLMLPQRHYEADVIQAVRAGRSEDCPADDSTIRRWKY